MKKKLLLLYGIFIPLLLNAQVSGQEKKDKKIPSFLKNTSFGIGAVRSKVERESIEFDTTYRYLQGLYYYDVSHSWGFEAQLTKSIPITKKFAADFVMGYRQNGFNAKHYVRADTLHIGDGLIVGTTIEEWSRFAIHSLRFSTGFNYDFNNIIKVKTQATFNLPLYVTEYRKEVEIGRFTVDLEKRTLNLDDKIENGMRVNNKKKYNATNKFRNFNIGIDFSIEHPVSEHFSIYGNCHISDRNQSYGWVNPSKTMYYLYAQNITFGAIYQL